MTELEIRIALAEVQDKLLKGPWTEKPNPFQGCPAFGYFNPQDKHLPELTLDWVHEIEKLLTLPDNWKDYIFWIRHLQAKAQAGVHCNFEEIHATKEQRAEAILRTLGKWEEG